MLHIAVTIRLPINPWPSLAKYTYRYTRESWTGDWSFLGLSFLAAPSVLGSWLSIVEQTQMFYNSGDNHSLFLCCSYKKRNFAELLRLYHGQGFIEKAADLGRKIIGHECTVLRLELSESWSKVFRVCFLNISSCYKIFFNYLNVFSCFGKFLCWDYESGIIYNKSGSGLMVSPIWHISCIFLFVYRNQSISFRQILCCL